jgi:two-component system, cell cycle response regulator
LTGLTGLAMIVPSMGSTRPPDDLEKTHVSNLAELQKELAARSRRIHPYLLVLAGGNVGEMYRIDEGETFVGRSGNVTIRIDDDGVSRRHARLFHAGEEMLIEDLGSSNGTNVNGTRVEHQAQLRDGDKIQLGSTTILKFTYHDTLDESFHQQMHEAAQRDALTKAYNKRYFLEQIEKELAYARRHHTALSLLMFDVDHFKRVNDTHGHLAGDYVLGRLSKLVSGTLRTEDIFCRYGGEEFCILCRGVTLINAGALAERVRATVETAVFEHEDLRMPITISIGVAAHPELPMETPTQLIAAADEALYEAKRGGRNRVLLKYAQL